MAKTVFDRARLPDWPTYAAMLGLKLTGRGRWRTIHCDFHDDAEPSMRVNVESGGWVCMACGAKGGDVLAHHMQRTGAPFEQAARELGAWDGHCAADTGTCRPARLMARDALSAITVELLVCAAVLADMRRGKTPCDADWQRFLAAAGRVQFIAEEVAK